MSRPQTPDNFYKRIQMIEQRLTRLESGIGTIPTFTTATLPSASANPGLLVWVSDAAAGTKFKRSNGTSWLTD